MEPIACQHALLLLMLAYDVMFVKALSSHLTCSFSGAVGALVVWKMNDNDNWLKCFSDSRWIEAGSVVRKAKSGPKKKNKLSEVTGFTRHLLQRALEEILSWW